MQANQLANQSILNGALFRGVTKISNRFKNFGRSINALIEKT